MAKARVVAPLCYLVRRFKFGKVRQRKARWRGKTRYEYTAGKSFRDEGILLGQIGGEGARPAAESSRGN